MDILTEVEKIAWEEEIRPVIEAARKEIKRLQDYGSPETVRGIQILILMLGLRTWSPLSESLDLTSHKETVLRAFRDLKDLLNIKNEGSDGK